MPLPDLADDRLSLVSALSALPLEWPDDLLPAIRALRQSLGQAMVVLDDDPTGTQTVSNLPVLTEWTPDALERELAYPSPTDTFYLLTNSRSLSLVDAQELNRAIGHNVRAAADAVSRAYAVISRSDSTLRGHFPGEVEALAGGLGAGFDATLLIPAFLDGGRYTLNDTHYVADGDWLQPAGTTEFARDHSFGYVNSNLRLWIAEKSGGRIPAASVESIGIDELRLGGPRTVCARLLSLPAVAVCVVNAASEQDLAVAALGALQAEAVGRRFLYRTAASFVRLRAGLPKKPLLEPAELDLPATGGGLIVAGSYVPRTTAQIEGLLSAGIMWVQVSVAALLGDDGGAAETARTATDVDDLLAAGKDVLLFTSRALVAGNDVNANLAIGRRVSEGLTSIVRSLRTRPRYLLAKGGITSSDIATHGLNVRRAWVLGQLLPGVPVWRLGGEAHWPGLTYVVFPGNVGGPGDLAAIVKRMSS